MAEITTITAARASEILGQSVISGVVNAQGRLILTRENGQTFDGGNFTDIVTSIFTQTVNDAVNTKVTSTLPAAVAGKFVQKGNLAGALTFTDFTADTLVNALITLTATGAITIDAANLPANPRPNTQFAVRITQDATGGRTLALTGFKRSQGVLSLTPTANAIDILVFMYDGTNWFAGMMGIDFR